MQEVIIVSTKKLRPFAVILKKGLGKFYDITASNWSDTHFKVNEATITNRNVLIFIGSSSIIDPYVNDIFKKPKFNDHNCNWGWEGPVAAIKVVGQPVHVSDFKEESKSFAAAERSYSGTGWEKYRYENNILNFIQRISLIFGPLAWTLALLLLKIPFHAKEQYKYAVGTFLHLGLPDFQISVDG